MSWGSVYNYNTSMGFSDSSILATTIATIHFLVRPEIISVITNNLKIIFIH